MVGEIFAFPKLCQFRPNYTHTLTTPHHTGCAFFFFFSKVCPQRFRSRCGFSLIHPMALRGHIPFLPPQSHYRCGRVQSILVCSNLKVKVTDVWRIGPIVQLFWQRNRNMHTIPLGCARPAAT